MNFTFSVIRSPDNQFGAVQPDGSWNGMVRLLVDGKVDIGKN